MAIDSEEELADIKHEIKQSQLVKVREAQAGIALFDITAFPVKFRAYDSVMMALCIPQEEMDKFLALVKKISVMEIMEGSKND